MILRTLLEQHQPLDAREAAMTARLLAFLDAASAGQGDAFGRELAGLAPDWGHVTGSAWIIDASGTRTVLVHHAKLGKWVQPGGHCDGEPNVLQVALREAREETGLEVSPLQPGLFDVDAHAIPAYWNTPAHWHFDARFLLRADGGAAPVVSAESRAVRWISLDEALQLNAEESLARMVAKTRRRFAGFEEAA